MSQDKAKRASIHITLADIERAYKDVEKFQRLLARGKTPEQIFKDMLRLIEVEK